MSLFSLWIAMVRLVLALSVPIETDHTHSAPIQEDSAEWNCKTMGNLICGEWNTETQTFDLVDYSDKGE